MDKPKYTKLSELVNDEFTIEKSYGFKWKKWDAESSRMLLSDKYEKGYRKMYTLVTDKGNLDLGAGQIGTLLEAVYKNGEAKLIGRAFAVKSNGKTGMDIRYYFNPTLPTTHVDEVVQVNDDEPATLDGIPF